MRITILRRWSVDRGLSQEFNGCIGIANVDDLSDLPIVLIQRVSGKKMGTSARETVAGHYNAVKNLAGLQVAGCIRHNSTRVC